MNLKAISVMCLKLNNRSDVKYPGSDYLGFLLPLHKAFGCIL